MSSLLVIKALLHLEALEERRGSPEERKKSERVGWKHNKRVIGTCRVCCKKGNIPIFANTMHPNIAENIRIFSDVTVDVNDGLPKTLCDECFELLNCCLKFRVMCQKSNKKLLKLQVQKSEIPDDVEHLDINHDSMDTPSPEFDITSHEESYPMSCLSCKGTFTDIGLYRQHLTQCNLKFLNCLNQCKENKKKPESKENLCEICGKSLASLKNLFCHRLTHKNVFPFKCDQCPYRGRTMDLLKVHKRSHSSVRPYMCSRCPKAFTTASNLTKHAQLHNDAKPFRCPFCDKPFRYKYVVKRHISEIHVQKPPVECVICNKKYNTRKALGSHRLKAHNLRAERIGRMPAYLQCVNEEPSSNSVAGDGKN